VRPSSKAGCFALSFVKGDGRVEHSLFRLQANGFRLDNLEFRTLDALISQYRQELLRLPASPAPRPRLGPTRSLSRGDFEADGSELDRQGYVPLPRTDS
jgi:hypothetical protein